MNRGGWASPSKPAGPAHTRPVVRPRDYLADAHGDREQARTLFVNAGFDYAPETDPIVLARAERYMDVTPASDANWDDCLNAAVRDRQAGRI
jgi:hypothetical protein